MTCIINGFAKPQAPARKPRPIWDPPPLTPPGWDHVTGKMKSPKAPPVVLAVQPASSSSAPALAMETASATAAFSAKDLPLNGPKDKAKTQQYLGGCRQYACSVAESYGSEWKKDMLKDAAPGLAAKGLLKNDISYANINTAGVCVMRTMSLPNIPPPGAQEYKVQFLKRSIRRAERQDARASKAFEAQKVLLANPGGNAGASSEVLPKHQRQTSGKPAICRPIDRSRQAVAEMMNAEDSHFTSEYRANGWWKQVSESQMKELKEHVRPYDNWTIFRDSAASVNKYSRFPINTY